MSSINQLPVRIDTIADNAYEAAVLQKADRNGDGISVDELTSYFLANDGDRNFFGLAKLTEWENKIRRTAQAAAPQGLSIDSVITQLQDIVDKADPQNGAYDKTEKALAALAKAMDGDATLRKATRFLNGFVAGPTSTIPQVRAEDAMYSASAAIELLRVMQAGGDSNAGIHTLAKRLLGAWAKDALLYNAFGARQSATAQALMRTAYLLRLTDQSMAQWTLQVGKQIGSMPGYIDVIAQQMANAVAQVQGWLDRQLNPGS